MDLIFEISMVTAPDKAFLFQPKNCLYFFICHKNMHYGYSLEVPRRGASNEYQQYIVSWINKKQIYSWAQLLETNDIVS